MNNFIIEKVQNCIKIYEYADKNFINERILKSKLKVICFKDHEKVK